MPRLSMHRLLHLAHGLKQTVVLHVARADLQNVGVLGHHGHRLDRHHLGDDGQPGLLTGFGQVFKPLEAESLEVVGAGARLEGAAAQHLGPGLLDGMGDLDDLLAALDAARSRHHDDLLPADLHLTAGNVEDGVVWAGGAAAEFVGFLDAQRVGDAFHGVKMLAGDLCQIADQGHNGSVFAVDRVGGATHFFGFGNDRADFGSGCIGFHYDDHGWFSLVGFRSGSSVLLLSWSWTR